MVQSLPQSDGFRILFNSPELSEVQRSGFHLFLKKGIADELSKISRIQVKNAHFLIEIIINAHNFRLVTPENNYRDCILKMKSYTCKLYVQTKILFKDKVSEELLYQTPPEWVLLADLPIMTKRGHFVINGSPRVVVHQVGRSPGVYFKKVLKLKKEVNNKARFYGDIIPRKGVWVRLQINKKGEIDFKLKKSKKVRAEMVQKCLEVLEKEESFLHFQKKIFEKQVYPTNTFVQKKSSCKYDLGESDFSSIKKAGVSSSMPLYDHTKNKLFFDQKAATKLQPFNFTTSEEQVNFCIKKLTFLYDTLDGQTNFNKEKVTFSLNGKFNGLKSLQKSYLDKQKSSLSKKLSFYKSFRIGTVRTYNEVLYIPKFFVSNVIKNFAFLATRFPQINTNKTLFNKNIVNLSVQTKTELFFSPQTSFLVGLDLNNCFDSKGWQTQAFSIGDTYKKRRYTKNKVFCIPSLNSTYAKLVSPIKKISGTECNSIWYDTLSLPFSNAPFKSNLRGSLCSNKFTLLTLNIKTGFTTNSTIGEFTDNIDRFFLRENNNSNFNQVKSKFNSDIRRVSDQKHNNIRFWIPQASLVIPIENSIENRENVTNILHLPVQKKKKIVLGPRLPFLFSRKITQLGENKQNHLQYKSEKDAFVNVYTTFYKNEIEDTEKKVSLFPKAEPFENKKLSYICTSPSFLLRRSQNTEVENIFKGKAFSLPLLSRASAPLKYKVLQDKSSKKTKLLKKKVAKRQNFSGNLQKIREYLYQLFKRSDLYDLGFVGREKINTKFGISVTGTQLTSLDIKETINWLSKLKSGKEEIDDIDHSENRRVRTSSELIQNQFEIGITRLKNMIIKKVRNGKNESIKAYKGKVTLPSRKVKDLPVNENVYSDRLFLNRLLSLLTFHGALILPTYKPQSIFPPYLSSLEDIPNHSRYVQKDSLDVQKQKTNKVIRISSYKDLTKPSAFCLSSIESFVTSFPEIQKLYGKGLFVKAYGKGYAFTYMPCTYVFTKSFCNRSAIYKNKQNLIRLYLPILFVKSSLGLQIIKTELLKPRSVHKKVQWHCKDFEKLKKNRFDLVTNTNILRKESTIFYKSFFGKRSWFNRLHFKNQNNCFIKDNKIVDKIKCNIKNRVTFTSVNPYFIKYQTEKKRYLSMFQKTSFFKQKTSFFKQKTSFFKQKTSFFKQKTSFFKQSKGNTLPLQIQPNLVSKSLLKGIASQACNVSTNLIADFWKSGSQKKSEYRLYKKFLLSETIKISQAKFVESLSITSIKNPYLSTFLRASIYKKQNYAYLPYKKGSYTYGTYEKAFVLPSSPNAKTYRYNKQLAASELFSTKPINGALREFFGSSPLSQYMDQSNPLAEITHKRRISSLGVGGVSRESAGMTIRGIHPTHYGRICPIETPEGKNAGLVNSLAFYAKINTQGFIETPYYQVIKGQVQHELGFSFYSARKESKNGLYIAPSDIKQSKSKLLGSTVSTVESIPIRVADNLLDLFKKINPYQVDCIGISSVQILSVATSLIPFLEHNDANRALMGSNMQRQAVPLMISERPLIGTGLEARVLAESGHLVQSKVSGFVSNVSAHKVVVERLIYIPLFVGANSKNIALQQSFASVTPYFAPYKEKENRDKQKFSHTYIRSLTSQKQKLLHNSVYKKRSSAKAKAFAMYNSIFYKDPQDTRFFFLTSTHSKYQAHKSFKLSQNSKNKCLSPKNLNFASFRPFRHQLSLFCFGLAKKETFLPVTHCITTFTRSNQETCLIQKPLVEEGDWVQKGDMLSDCSAGQKGELSVGKNVLIAYIPWQGYNFEDAIVISDRLLKEQLYTSLHIERYTIIVNDFKDKVVDTNEWFTANLPGIDSKKITHLQKSGLPIIGTFLKEGDILVGKVKYSKKKPSTPHEKLVCDILGEQNFSVQNTSLYVPKGVHQARVITYKIKKRFEKALKSNLRPKGAPKVVHIFLGEKRNIQIGDKMSGRHGNKGIVSTILPKQDMPYLADGTPIDILLNPLGVPSRMNVGQVFECLLGLASTYLYQNFKVTAFDELYGTDASQSLVFLKLYQARLQSGQNWLFQINFPGKTRLTDGRSGECFDQWITVGRAYMLKLIHMVNEKIHARAIGPYALVTQQPLKGRAHKGGQRLGEMEVWAVEGFGAAYILQELLTKKSDDSIGRKEILKAMLPKPSSFLDFIDFTKAETVEQTSYKELFSDSFHKDERLPLDIQQVSRKSNFSTFTFNGGITSEDCGIDRHIQKQKFLDKSSRPSSHLLEQNNLILGQPDIFKVLICELQALCLDVGVYSMKTESFQRKFLGFFE